MTKTIDITPSWAGMVNVIIALLDNGGPKGRATAREELAKMAKLADLYVAERKAQAADDDPPDLDDIRDVNAYADPETDL